jgi:DNA ligase-4
MSRWTPKEEKAPDEDALREDDLQYGTSGMTEAEIAEK